MNPITFRPVAPANRRVDLSGILPSRIRELTIEEILKLPIQMNETETVLGDGFEVTDGDRTTIIFDGDLSNCDYVGGGLDGGHIQVTGNVGDFLADGMSAGSIEVFGAANRYACSGLRGGLVRINGDCGQYAASAAPGAKRGMNGGILIIQGDCDQWLATRMRRGTVVVHGRVAAACASRMIAGTLVLCGRVDFPLAANMARGTILLLEENAACIPPAGFTAPEHTELSYLQILVNEIAPHLPNRHRESHQPGRSLGFGSVVFQSPVFRSLGDRVNNGLGEIIWLRSGPIHADTHFAHA